MVHAQALREQTVLQLDHVVVFVMRKAHVQAVARLAGFAMAYVVRKDDEVLRRVKDLAGAEDYAAEIGSQKLPAGATGAVQNEHRIANFAAGIFLRRAQRVVMQLHLRQLLAGFKLKVLYNKCPGLRRGIVRAASRHSCDGDEQGCEDMAELHVDLLKTEKLKSLAPSGKGISSPRPIRHGRDLRNRFTLFFLFCT